MRILQLLPYFYPAWSFGGPVRVLYDISRELVKRGHEVVVYASDAKDLNSRVVSDFEEIDGVKACYFRNASMFLAKRKIFVYPSMIPAVRKNIEMFDIVHVHGYMSFQNLVLYHYLKKKPVPYVLQAHGTLSVAGTGKCTKTIYDLFVGRRILRNASKVIALSNMEARQYRDMGVPQHKINVTPNGIDLSEYANLPARGSFKKKFSIPDEKKIILYVGRIHRSKGIDFLIKAYSYLIREMECDNGILVIAGPDDGYANEVKSLVAKLKLQDRVILAGMLSETDKIKAYIDSSLCTYLNQYEPFGLVPLEAAACGTAVVVSKGTYMSDVIDDGNFGSSVEYGNSRDLASVLKRIISNEELRESFGRNGRRYVTNNFNLKKITKRIEQVYESVVDPPNTSGT
jgi:glycosyltransferase involved in cell wall biosynthesis